MEQEKIKYSKIADFSHPATIRELVEKFLAEIKNLFEDNTRNQFYIALSGGSTPLKIYQNLSDQERSLIDWNKIVFYWGDERCVPPDDEESNYGNTKSAFLDYLDIPEVNIIRMRGEDQPAKEVKRYSQELEQLPFVNGYPVFDLIFLGIGDDGHTASLFPDKLSNIDSKELVLHAVQPESGQDRISLTANVINNASRIVFLASGESKMKVISEIQQDSKKALEFPVYYIRPVNGSLIWYILD